MAGLDHTIKISLDKEGKDFVEKILSKVTGQSKAERLRILFLTGCKLIEAELLKENVKAGYIPFNSKLMVMHFEIGEEGKNANQ